MGWCGGAAVAEPDYLSPWAQRLCLWSGALYSAGLVPFLAGRLEGHTAGWHAFVLAAAGCTFAVHFGEVARPERWTEVARASWGGL
jgi:predicted membrane channel-forming protein YqfA (hemolysin III family)